MKSLFKSIFLFSLTMVFMANSANAKDKKQGKIVGQEVTYTVNSVTMKGYVAYNASQKGKRPAIVVVPEWWGNNEYTKKRARMLAELGYIAIAADMYGDGKIAVDPKRAQEYAMPFYKDPSMGKERIEAAITKLKEYPETDADNVAAIGYCFGGSMVLNAAKLGTDLKGVVSFHGGLATAPAAKGIVKGKILICNGAADKFVPETDIANFRKNLDTTGVSYKFINYTDATHAFTNPESTENGKKFNMPIAYNEAADKKSWADMKAFFKTIF
jgi:dienelactone hydrolase